MRFLSVVLIFFGILLLVSPETERDTKFEARPNHEIQHGLADEIEDVVGDPLPQVAGFTVDKSPTDTVGMQRAPSSKKIFARINSKSGLRLRATASTRARILETLSKGAVVEVAGQVDHVWVIVRTESRRVGFVDGSYLTFGVDEEAVETEPQQPIPWALLKSTPQTTRTPSHAAVTDAIIQSSRAGHSGNCACPYDTKRNGDSCGDTSAYIRSGGASPLCYPHNVNDAMIADWLSSNTLAEN